MSTPTFWDKLKSVFTKKEFWALITGAAFLIIKTVWPEFPLSEEAITTLVLAIVGSLLGLSFASAATIMGVAYWDFATSGEAKSTFDNFWTKLKVALENKQFWVLSVGAGFILLKAFWPAFPLSQETLSTLVLAIVASLLGISFVDYAVQKARLVKAMKFRASRIGKKKV